MAMMKKTEKMSAAQVLTDRHTGHAEHMCELVGKRQMAKVAKYSANAKFICHICGRAAADGKNLCEPVEI